MRLIIAVVKNELANNLTDELTRAGFSTTKLASTGGFLKAGNTTFLVGVPTSQVDQALAIVKGVCPAEGGATVFVLDVEKLVKV